MRLEISGHGKLAKFNWRVIISIGHAKFGSVERAPNQSDLKKKIVGAKMRNSMSLAMRLASA